MDAREIIIRPLVTEKGTHTSGDARRRAYPFEVHQDANKAQVRAAIEKIYSVRVMEVRTANMHGKFRRQGQWMGQTRNWKKAVVKLHPDDHIDLF
ncbi:MAG: 50S ribosomal protein L23 [Phycisphaerae bacterium]|nr:50S ribosomal protein L23 [Phycisphaerae bacterium]